MDVARRRRRLERLPKAYRGGRVLGADPVEADGDDTPIFVREDLAAQPLDPRGPTRPRVAAGESDTQMAPFRALPVSRTRRDARDDMRPERSPLPHADRLTKVEGLRVPRDHQPSGHPCRRYDAMTESSRGGEDAGVADEVEVGGRNLQARRRMAITRSRFAGALGAALGHAAFAARLGLEPPVLEDHDANTVFEVFDVHEATDDRALVGHGPPTNRRGLPGFDAVRS